LFDGKRADGERLGQLPPVRFNPAHAGEHQ
jgi:hypothetical protein